ncbi:MAG: sodium/solute symporter [Phycisphaerae bacterium]
MIYSFSPTALAIFLVFVGTVLGLSFYLGRRARSARGYFAAHGEIPWFINGVAFAGDYLSAASFLGICGMIAFYGYDGFLYSIGFLAGWAGALFVIAEPIKRLGKFTFADALDSQFNSRGIKLAAAISTLVVSVFYLIPQMVGAGALIKPLLGLPPFSMGPLVDGPFALGGVGVGAVVILIVVTAGMVSTTWVQFIKGSLLVLFCLALTVAILRRGLTTEPSLYNADFRKPEVIALVNDAYLQAHHLKRLPEEGAWAGPVGRNYVRLQDESGRVRIFRKQETAGWTTIDTPAEETQYKEVRKDGKVLVNGLPPGKGAGHADFFPVGNIVSLPPQYNTPGSPGATTTGPLGPSGYLAAFSRSTIGVWRTDTVTEKDGTVTTIYYRKKVAGSELLAPGNHPMFAGIRSNKWSDKLNFLSLMLALFCGTAALPHILIRYYTVKNQAAARKSTVVGIVSIGLFYVLTLYLGLGAMTSGVLDPTDSNMAAPLLAKSFGNLVFALISATAFTTVLGTVSGLIMAAAGAVAHDLLHNLFGMDMDDARKVRAGKLVSVGVGILAILLGIAFRKMNVSFLVGWAFNVAASANLPAITMLLFWKRTTKQGIAASIFVGLATSLVWILLSGDAYKYLYETQAASPMPFNQPGLVTIPLSYLTLIVVSLVTPKVERIPVAAR